ncbi:MAG: nucleotide sugar dehydrogenase, partial [Gammaproteobacteria bacterium]
MKETICIAGLGYVGLPLAECFVHAGFCVVGYDADGERIAQLQSGRDIGGELCEGRLSSILPHLTLTDDINVAKECTAYLIAVPTPLDDGNKPDLSPLRAACAAIGGVLKRGDVVVVESTVYPGVTEEVCAPLLARVSGLRYNDDFVCGYSPERISPGDKSRRVADIVKVTAGSTAEAAKRVDDLYRAAITAGTTPAPSIRVAEAAKAVENTQRDVNIALMNELAMLLESAGLDSGEVFAAAGSKWNFLPFSPGLVGGHCIGVDPYYLLHKAQS